MRLGKTAVALFQAPICPGGQRFGIEALPDARPVRTRTESPPQKRLDGGVAFTLRVHGAAPFPIERPKPEFLPGSSVPSIPPRSIVPASLTTDDRHSSICVASSPSKRRF